MPTPQDAEGNNQKDRFLLFFICCLAYVSIGVHFCIRGGIGRNLEAIFSRTDPKHSSEMAADVLAVPFLGYAITLFLISPFIDAIGMGRLMRLSGILLAIGTVIVISAEHISSDSVYWIIWFGMLLIGLGWGLVDTNTNPLVVGLYPKEKTHRLNVIHAWWPAGIVIGGLAGLALSYIGVEWKYQLVIALIPAVLLVILCFIAKFPLTERAAAGISFGDMFIELFKRPMFWVWFFCIWLTATSELVPGQWVDMVLTRTIGMRGIWLVIYISGLMFVMRHFAGAVMHKLSPVGLLWFSCLLAAAGLWWLSIAGSPLTAILGATLWGIGVCYMWPTMLATVNERYPRSGALGMGLMGTGATLAMYLFLPRMGQIFDTTKIKEAGGEEAFALLKSAADGKDAIATGKLNEVLTQASQASFQAVAYLPAALLVVFAVIWIYDRKHGVKHEELDTSDLQK
ncbi:MAG: MFS transporter [Phycisphaerales bacterium]|jgi:fucose permease|nr:MFS transporter [Phycisphaerales bacterium]